MDFWSVNGYRRRTCIPATSALRPALDDQTERWFLMHLCNERSALILLAALAVTGCKPSSGDAPSAGSSASPAARSTEAGGAKPSSAAPGGKTTHIKRTQGECTFELDAPEEMKESAKDDMSFTLESASFEFIGYEGTQLHSNPKHALDMFKGEYKDAYRGTENGVQVAVVTAVKDKKDAADKHVISGMGGEPFRSGHNEGCTFSCSGVQARESDVVKLCKSVRISVNPAPQK